MDGQPVGDQEGDGGYRAVPGRGLDDGTRGVAVRGVRRKGRRWRRESQYRQLTKWIQRREKWCVGVKPVPSAAVIHPISNLRLTGMIRGDWQDDVSDAVCGAHKMLVESHWPVDIVGEETLGELGRFELLVVPEISYVSDEVAAKLADYVHNGGTLLATGPSSRMDERGRRREGFALAELLGIHYVTDTEFSARYLDIAEGFAEGIPSMPILVKAGRQCPGFARFFNIRVEPGTEVLAEFVDPPFEANLRRHVYHQHGHPAAKSAATCRSGGDGSWSASIGMGCRRYGWP